MYTERPNYIRLVWAFRKECEKTLFEQLVKFLTTASNVLCFVCIPLFSINILILFGMLCTTFLHFKVCNTMLKNAQ